MTHGRVIGVRAVLRAFVLVGACAAGCVWLLQGALVEASSCAGSSAGPRCEMFTTIVNAGGRVVTTAVVDVEVHPRVVLVGSPTPSGTVRFDWFANATCEGAPVARSPEFAVANGVIDGAAFTQIPRKAGGYAVLARYSGDGTHVAAVGDCQALTVTRSAPRLIASSLSVGVPEGEMVIVGQTASVTTQLSITSDASLSRVVVSYGYENQRFASAGPLPSGCVLAAGSPDAEHDAIVCSAGRVQMGPGATTFTRAFQLAFQALGATAPEGSSVTAEATFEFEGSGQATPFKVEPETVALVVVDAPRLRLPQAISATQGESVVVPILLDATLLRVPAEFRFTLTYDTSLLQLDALVGGALASGGDAIWSVAEAGRVSVTVPYGGGGEAGGASQSLALARFTALGSAGQGPLGLVGAAVVPESGGSAAFEVEGIGGTVTVVPVQAAPVPAPAPPPAAEPESEPERLPSMWDERLWTPEHVGASLGFATLLGVTLTALAEIFNATVEENRDHFVGWWRLRRHRLIRFVRRDATGLLGAFGGARGASALLFGTSVALYLLAAAVLFAFLEPERALETPDVAILAAGFAIVATTLSSQLPRWWYVRRLDRSGALLPPAPGHRLIELHADFWTLAFALFCVFVAYETAVRPGYAYGIVGVLAINRSLRLKPDHEQGQLQPWHMDWVSMLCLFVASIAAWLGYSVAHAAHSEVPAFLLERFWILGAETVALGLIPLSFLPGRSLWEWSRLRWACLWVLALFLYIQSVTAHAVGAGPLAIALTLVGYGACTVAFWVYFKRGHDEESCESCRVVNASSLRAEHLEPAGRAD